MSTLKQAKKEILDFLSANLGDVQPNLSDIDLPPDKKLGDLAYPCFDVAKALKSNPVESAKTIAKKFQSIELVESCFATGPYLNFKLNRKVFATTLMKEVMDAPDRWGESEMDNPETVMVEYAQPNTHKELHVGHLRNLALGLSVVNLWKASGQKVIPVCYIGDVGAHVAKCLWCLKKYHEDELANLPENKGSWLAEIYTEATRRVDQDESLKEEVAEVQRKLEAGDSEWDSLWRETREWSLDELRRVYDELGIELDKWYFESQVEERGKEIVKEMLEKGMAEEGERGAIIVDLEEDGLGVALILKSDGSSLYMTKELALAERKFEKYPDIDHSIHVVDSRQSLYFKQFFKILEMLGFKKKLTHLAYEFVTLKEGAMSSRSGNVITYQDFRDEMVKRAAEETKKRRTEWSDEQIDKAAWQIAEAAMKFGMLKQDPDKSIVFDIDSALSFDGFSGPYLQYAHARLSSILRKAGEEADSDGQIIVSDNEDEFAVLSQAARFPEVVAIAAEQNKPSILAQYLFDFSQAVSQFYRDVPVISADTDEERTRRLHLIKILRLTLSRGLAILGIQAPVEM